MKLSCAAPYRQPACQRQHKRANRIVYTHRSDVQWPSSEFDSTPPKAAHQRADYQVAYAPRLGLGCKLDDTKANLTLGWLSLSRREGYGFAHRRCGFTLTCHQGQEKKIAAQHSQHLLLPPAFITAVYSRGPSRSLVQFRLSIRKAGTTPSSPSASFPRPDPGARQADSNKRRSTPGKHPPPRLMWPG